MHDRWCQMIKRGVVCGNCLSSLWTWSRGTTLKFPFTSVQSFVFSSSAAFIFSQSLMASPKLKKIFRCGKILTQCFGWNWWPSAEINLIFSCSILQLHRWARGEFSLVPDLLLLGNGFFRFTKPARFPYYKYEYWPKPFYTPCLLLWFGI